VKLDSWAGIVFDGGSGIGRFTIRENIVIDQMLPARKFRIQCFDRADRWFKRAVGVMTAVHEGFWLGCLSADDLNAVTAKHFDESQFYASNAHNLSGFFDWEPPLLERYFRRGSRILVAAAGAGRETLALRKAGFDADGFECSPLLVRASQEIFDQLGESKCVTYCPPDTVPSGPPVYEGLIIGWSGYTHIPTRLRRIAFLQALRQRALPRSPLLMSFFTRLPDSYDKVVYRTATLCRFFGGRELLSPGDHLEWRRYVHRFTRDEVEAELEAAGFRIEHYNERSGDGQAVAIAE
jgi:hypothetical protein